MEALPAIGLFLSSPAASKRLNRESAPFRIHSAIETASSGQPLGALHLLSQSGESEDEAEVLLGCNSVLPFQGTLALQVIAESTQLFLPEFVPGSRLRFLSEESPRSCNSITKPLADGGAIRVQAMGLRALLAFTHGTPMTE